jgi:nitroreductase
MTPASGGTRPPDSFTLDRRRFLLLAGGAAAYLALQPTESWAKKAAKQNPSLQPWVLPEEIPGNPVDAARALIGAAVLAPSDWNAQPWRFEVEGNTIRLVADARRALPITDPARRGMMIGLGASLENLLIAARSWGQRTNVSYLPHDGANGVVAEVTWAPGDPKRDRSLFAAIPDRRTNRHDFDGRGVFPQNRTQLMAESMEGLGLYWLDDSDKIDDVGDVAYEATHEQVSNPKAQAEQFGWMRFDNDAEKRGDGIPVDALELSGPAHWFAGRYFNPSSWFLRWGAEYAGKQARGQVKSSGALLLMTTARQEEMQWLMCGQSYERIALKASNLGIAQQILSAPTEVEHYRAGLRTAFGVPVAEQPLLLVRLGHAKKPDATPRRAVSLVSTFRNT